MKGKKKVLALALCIAMVLTMFGGVAFAEGEDVQDDVQITEPAPETSADGGEQPVGGCIEGCVLPEGHEGECTLKTQPEPEEDGLVVEDPTEIEPDETVNASQAARAVPANALAAEEVTTAEDLKAALEAGGEVTLSASIELAAGTQFNIENAVTLDLNGFSITRAGDSSSKLFSVKNNGSLTLNDSKGGGAIQSTYPVQLWSNSAFIMNGGDITSSRGAALDIFSSASNVKVEINKGSLKADADNTFGIRGSENVVVDIKGGEILSETNRLAIYVSGNKDNAIQLNISGGSIQNEGQAIQAYSGAVINVSGSANIHSETGTAISTQSGYGAVELNISGGNISTASSTGYAVQAREESCVNISGGTITGGTAVQVSDSATVNINGGTLEGKRAAIGESSGSTANIQVVSGTFSDDSVEKYLAPGASLGEADGNYTVTTHYVAEIDGQQYTTLAAAVAAAGTGGIGTEITLLDDITDAPKIAIKDGKEITINFNSYDIGFAQNCCFDVQGGTLNLEGEGMAYEQSPYYSPVMITGMGEGEAQTVVNVGSDVTLKGWSGLFIDYNNVDLGADYGIDVNVYGTLISVQDTAGAGGHALYINGTIKNTEGAVPQITLDGATLTNEDGGNGMYLAGYAETEIRNSTITSGKDGSTGIEIRAGKLTISDSEVTGGSGEYEGAPNGNGSTSSNVALAVAQHTTKLPIEVTVEEGTVLTGGAAFAQSNPQKNEEDAISKVEAAIEGGTFNGQVYAENVTGFISGGTFSEELENAYAAPGFEVIENEDGTFGVAKLQNVYVSGSGSDDNNGTDAANAVQTLERALELVAEDGTIYICGTVTVDADLTVDGAKIERANGFGGTLITITGTDVELTLTNTTIDGKKADNTTGKLVNITGGATLSIEAGTKLINNNETAVQVGANSTLNMNGGEISGNTTENGWGAAILNYGTANLNSGEIKSNTAPWGGGIMALGGSVTVLDGASITGNTATTYGGGGIYLYGDGQQNAAALLEVKSGSISGNTAEFGTGGGIFAHYQYGDVTVKISGGTIKDNVSTDENMGHAIGLYGYEGSIAYPRLELSGSPEIDGDIYYQNDYEDGYVIHVTGAFTPAKAIEINRSNNKDGIPAVEYAAGLTPNLEDFVSGTIFEKLVVEGQNLVWMDASIVYFYDEDGTEFKENRHGVVMGETIDPADVPTPVKEGYTLTGWYEKNAAEPWDFAADTVSKTSTKLYARWSLNAPDIAVSADVNNPHVGTEAVLTATPSHDLDGVTYTYQWYKDGTPIEGETGATLTVSESGSYTVKVKASDGAKESAETESAAVVITVEGHVYVPEVTAPTCTEQGYTTYTCAVCGDSYIDDYTPAEGHQAAAEWLSDGTSHWHACTVCGAKLDEAAHSFAWVTDKEATDTEAGLKHEECTVCGYRKDAVEIPATGTTEPGSTESGDDTTPKTEDSANTTLYLVLIAVAAAAIIAILIAKKAGRRNQA